MTSSVSMNSNTMDALFNGQGLNNLPVQNLSLASGVTVSGNTDSSTSVVLSVQSLTFARLLPSHTTLSETVSNINYQQSGGAAQNAAANAQSGDNVQTNDAILASIHSVSVSDHGASSAELSQFQNWVNNQLGKSE